MEWSPQQDNALLAVDDWYRNSDQQVFRVFGYAGSGKTTLAKHFSEGIKGDVLFGAFTGKAAHVLQTKGCPATTIHALIYHTKEKGQAKLKELERDLIKLKTELAEQGKSQEEIEAHKRVTDIRSLIQTERKNLSRPAFTLNTDSIVKNAPLVVIDECSMVDDQMGADLLSFGTKVLVLGDPAQLPPIGGAGFFTENVKPDVMLDEIHRQAAGNPIIDLATRVRQGKTLSLGNYGESKIISLDQVNQQEVLAADQLLVGKNVTRFNYNSRLRELHGRYSKAPEAGDKLVCLRNNHDLGLLNGAIHTVSSVGHHDSYRTHMIVEDEAGRAQEVESHSQHFYGRGDEIPFYERKEAEEFDYGYALTCHKAQGSQWNDVMVFDESFCFRQNKNKWLYTAITRAAEKITIVRM